VRKLLDSSAVISHLGEFLDAYLPMIPVSSEEYLDNGIPIANTLRKAYAAGDAEQALEFLLRWLYRVRCNLFHGNKNFNVQTQREMLRRSSMILDVVLGELVSGYCRGFGVVLPRDLQRKFHADQEDVESTGPNKAHSQVVYRRLRLFVRVDLQRLRAGDIPKSAGLVSGFWL